MAFAQSTYRESLRDIKGKESTSRFSCIAGSPGRLLSKLLFNRNAFREIAWLVDIGAFEDGGMVR